MNQQIARLLNRAQHPAQGAIYQTTTQDVGYYAISAARTCLNLYLVSLRLPSSSRFGDLLPIISYLRASQGRRAVKIPTVGAHRGADRRDHWESLKNLSSRSIYSRRSKSSSRSWSKQIQASQQFATRLQVESDSETEPHATRRSRQSQVRFEMDERWTPGPTP